MVKSRVKKEAHQSSEKAAEALADKIADKPYGTTAAPENPDEVIRLTVALPLSIYDAVESLARQRKRAKAEDRSMSAITREALKEYLRKHKT